MLLTKTIIIFLIAYLNSLNLIEIPKNNNQLLSINSRILLILFIGPIFEEILFRLHLLYSKINLSITIFALTYSILSYFFNVNFYNFNFPIFVYRFILSLIIAITFYSCLKNLDEKFKLFWNKFQIYITYSSVLIFALIHLTNFKDIDISIPNLALLILPYFLTAMFFTYIRFRASIMFSILIHLFNNLIGLLIYIS